MLLRVLMCANWYPVLKGFYWTGNVLHVWHEAINCDTERHLCICDSFTRQSPGRKNPTGKSSLWHLAPNVGARSFLPVWVKNCWKCPKMVPKCNSPFFMSIVFSGGWKGPTRGEKCCHVVRASGNFYKGLDSHSAHSAQRL